MHDLTLDDLVVLDAAEVQDPTLLERTMDAAAIKAGAPAPEGARAWRMEWRFERCGEMYGSAIEMANWRSNLVIDRAGTVREVVRLLTGAEIDAAVRSTRRILIVNMVKTAEALAREDILAATAKPLPGPDNSDDWKGDD